MICEDTGTFGCFHTDEISYATWKNSTEHNATQPHSTICKSLKDYLGYLPILSSLEEYGNNLNILFTLYKYNVFTMKHLMHMLQAIHFLYIFM